MKLIKIILLLLCIPVSVFANSQIDIETNNRNLQVGETFTVTITLNDINLQQNNAEISLPGVENFEVFSQSVSNSFQNINGVSESLTQFILQLTAKNSGNFELGPVEILGGEELKDNEKLNISVSGLPGVSPNIQNNQEEDVLEVIEKQIENSTDTDLRGPREVEVPLWAHGAFLLFFILSFYLLLSYVLSGEKSEKQNIIATPAEDRNSQYIDYFNALSSKIGKITSEDFFHEFNVGIRKIFSDISKSDTQCATLIQLSKDTSISSDSRFTIFKKSYKHEYSGIAISTEKQKKFIDDILKTL